MRKYDDEFKELVLQKVSDGQSVASVANEMGVNESTVHQWRRKCLVGGKAANGRSGEQPREIAELNKRLRESEMEVEILKRRHSSSGAEAKAISVY